LYYLTAIFGFKIADIKAHPLDIHSVVFKVLCNTKNGNAYDIAF